MLEGVKPGGKSIGDPRVLNKGRVEYVSMAELRDIDDERKVKRELFEI